MIFYWLLLRPEPGRTWTQKNWISKTWALKNMDPEKHRINMRLKNMFDFRELCFIKTMHNVICYLKVLLLTDISFFWAKNCSYNNFIVKLKS